MVLAFAQIPQLFWMHIRVWVGGPLFKLLANAALLLLFTVTKVTPPGVLCIPGPELEVALLLTERCEY